MEQVNANGERFEIIEYLIGDDIKVATETLKLTGSVDIG